MSVLAPCVNPKDALLSATGSFVRASARKRPCHFAHAHVVKSHVEVEVAVPDQAVVGNDGNTGFIGEVHGFRHGVAVVRRDDDDIHAFRDESLNIGHLANVGAIGALYLPPRADFDGSAHEGVPVALPAFFLQGVERKADERFGVRQRRRRFGVPPLRKRTGR